MSEKYTHRAAPRRHTRVSGPIAPRHSSTRAPTPADRKRRTRTRALAPSLAFASSSSRARAWCRARLNNPRAPRGRLARGDAMTVSRVAYAARLLGIRGRAARDVTSDRRARRAVMTASAVVEEDEMRVTEAAPGKRRVVVLGSGWGAISFVKSLESNGPYDVTLVSPRNYFLYTPLLPGAATGAVEDRSIVEPIRRPIASKGYRYFEANALSVNLEAKTVRCRGSDHTFQSEEDLAMSQKWKEFDLEYDYLVTAVGAVPNTFGVPGVKEHCMFFKEIVDAARFRREVNERFECATLPGVPRERIKKLLKFVVIGAGPTGLSSPRSCTITCTKMWRKRSRDDCSTT